MAPALITPDASGATTPTAASELTQAGIKHVQAKLSKDPELAPLNASLLRINLNEDPKHVPEPDSAEVKAQKTCTDHMITARWTVEHGWEAPELKPYGPFSIMPNASVLHYATECFEGLKLYRGFDGKLRLFRVDRNCQRMRRSAARIALPDFEPEELEKLIVALCARDGAKWLPKTLPGHFLYLRPTFIGTDPTLGVQRPKEALLYIILACFPDMTKSLAPSAPPALNGDANGKSIHTVSGLKLLASNEDTIRAWPGGFGYAKVGANYGPSLVAQGEARSRGFDQVLWLFGEDCSVTEAGASNFFVVWKNASTGRTELVTAPLQERIILEGITRASILDLARERYSKDGEQIDVVERKFTMADLITAHEENRLIEAFAAGTAFFVAPVGLIHFRGKDIYVPMDGDSGKFAREIKQWLSDIIYGNTEHSWGKVVEEVSM